MTVQNNEEDYIYDQFNLDEKEFDIRASQSNPKNSRIHINEGEDQIPNLKASQIKRRKEKKAEVKVQ